MYNGLVVEILSSMKNKTNKTMTDFVINIVLLILQTILFKNCLSKSMKIN